MVGWILMLRTVVIFEIRNDVLIKPCLELGSHTCGRLRLQGSHMFYYVFMEAVDLKMITNNFKSMILRLVGLLFRVLCVSAGCSYSGTEQDGAEEAKTHRRGL